MAGGTPHHKFTAVCLLCLAALAQLPSLAAAASAGGSTTATPRRLLTNQRGQGAGCACPRIYMPVCGSDGLQYNTRCEAECRGVSVTGQRPVNGVCNSGAEGPVNPTGPGFVPSGTPNSRPWFQSGLGNTARSGGLGINTNNPQAGGPGSSSNNIGGSSVTPPPTQTGGATRPGGQRVCPCPLIYAPVCGADGKSYPTKCAADCIGVSIASQGNCPGQGA